MSFWNRLLGADVRLQPPASSSTTACSQGTVGSLRSSASGTALVAPRGARRQPRPDRRAHGQRLGDGDELVLTKTAAELRAEMASQGERATR